MTNIHDRQARDQRGHFIIENPASSALWYARCFQRLLSQHGVTYGTLDMCSFGMKDPSGYYYNKPTSLLHNLDEDIMSPVFKRCTVVISLGVFNISINHWKVQHQAMEAERS